MDEFDVIIIGSGIGASPAAANLAESGAKVCILERGTWWGDFQGERSFPETRLQLLSSGIRNINNFKINKKGLFEFSFINRFLIWSASGVGGGSLIIGGFFDVPPRDMWDHYPPEITYENMQPHYKNFADIVKPDTCPKETPYSEWITEGCKNIPNLKVLDAEQTISFGSGPDAEESWVNDYGVTQKNCNYCGLCMFGCNRGSKNSMDLNYLQTAMKNDAVIKDLCEVFEIRKEKDGYTADFIDHRTGQRSSITAPKMIIAANALNTLKLLFKARRNKIDGLPLLSERLGYRWGFNGDRAGFYWTWHKNLKHGDGTCLFKKQEISSEEYDWDWHMFACRMGILGYPKWSPLSMLLNRLMPFLSLTREEPIGRLYEDEKNRLKMYYPAQESHLKATIMERRIAMEVDAVGRKGGLDPRKRERKMAEWSRFKPFIGITSVHPSGGAAMAEGIKDGVIDYKGEVFNYPGLFVCDSAIIPVATASGPHATIAALSDYISRGIVAREKG